MSSHKRAPSEESMESFSIEICDFQDLEELLEMKQDGFFQNRKPKRFEIGGIGLHQPDWNHEIFEALIEVFFHFHDKGIIWEEGRFKISLDNVRFMPALLHAVNTMKIFKNMSLYFRFHGHLTELSDLCPGLASNTLIQELSITYRGKSSSGYCLALNNLLQTNAPCLQKLHLFELSHFGCRWILPGLRDNKTLKYIHFETHATLTGATPSAIVAALGTNPSLEFLSMTFNTGRNGDLISEALKTLLTNSTSLTDLTLHFNTSTSGKLNAECIIQGLKNSRSLQALRIESSLYGDLIFARLFRILPDCPLIERIRIDDNDEDKPIFSEEDLVQVKLLPRLPRPIKLDLNVDPYFSMKRHVELLRCHPEVRMYNIDWGDHLHDLPDSSTTNLTDDATRTQFIHALHLNWHGRYLLDRPNFPLSIWPLVLEKVNRRLVYKYKNLEKAMEEEDQASVIYELLQGPAWGKRTSF